MAIINRLRFVDILRPSLGDQASREFADALQEEMAPLAGEEPIRLLAAQMEARFAQMEARLQRFIMGAVGLILAAIGIATAVIIAFT